MSLSIAIIDIEFACIDLACLAFVSKGFEMCKLCFEMLLNERAFCDIIEA